MKWEKTKKKSLFYLWPMAISALINLFVVPIAVNASPKLALLTPWLSLLVFAPFIAIEMRRNKTEAAREKCTMQAKYDAEDKAMFGQPLRELEI